MNPCCHQKEDDRQFKTRLLAQAKTFPQKRAAHGFTLIELLVVISIISLLISILLPSLAAARDSAKAIQCASNERGIGMAISFYANDNDQYYPTSVIYPVPLVWSQIVGTKYLNMKQSSNWAIGSRPASIFACPSSELLMTGGTRGDYGINWHISGNTNQNGINPATGNLYVGSLRATDFSDPSAIILTADAIGRTLINGGLNPINMEGRHKRGLAGTDLNNVVNVLYCDGHVTAAAMNTLVVGLNATAFGKRPWKP